MIQIKTEKWKKKRMIVARDMGRLVSSTAIKKPISSYLRYFKKHGTFSTKYDEKRIYLSNVVEVTRTYKNEKDMKQVIKQNRQAQISAGTYDVGGRDGIFARSDKGTSYEKMIAQSYDRFFKRIHQHFDPSGYDSGEGYNIVRQNKIGVLKGVIWYQEIRKRAFKRKRIRY